MNALKNLAVTICFLFAAVQFASAQAQRGGQPNDDNRPPASEGQVRDEVHQFISNLDDPNYDYSKVPEQMRNLFTDFRSLSQTMDPDQARQFRSELMPLVFPVLQRHQDQIRKAVQEAIVKDLQEPLGCSDDEFQAIRPALNKVFEAMQAAGQALAFGPRGQQGNQQLSATDLARESLQTAVDDPNSNADLIHTRLDDFRQAIAKAKQDLAVSRDALRSLLTVRQEGVLVDRGILD